ncbi:MAG: adenosylcobalamin-dependent ribonucleoside-diphosphate reductase [Candidatus Parvarchaeota archaeon]|nr:adenosylcobalamin-dependent ribonucleoside-diphosphate reductase [Candidatus Parvarchaeota archaeon]
MPVKLPKETLEFFKNNELQARIFFEKYALRGLDGNQLETLPTQMWKRISKAIASVESSDEAKKEFEKKFYWLLEDFKFVPGGRILFGAGSNHTATLLNCYYLPLKHDSIEGIYDCAKEMAKTYSYGGGVGIDVSILRPVGTLVNNAARFTTGAVSFMELYSVTTGLIGQQGRRGALMITMDVHHPDIQEFVMVKADKVSVRFANISVKLYDDFMHAVENDKDYELYFKNDRVEKRTTINARALWDKIIDTALNTGDPGIMFWDRIKRESPTEYDERMCLNGTNPCGEQPLPNYGACDLGAINLDKFVLESFTDKASVDWENLEKTVRYGVRFLDDVLDYSYSRHALKAQAEQSMYERRIGLGVMGLANMLINMKIKYDSDAAVTFANELFRRLKEIAYDESSNLSVLKGSFKGFNSEKHLERDFVKRLSDQLKKKIAEKGLRNSCILTIAPTGSISTMTGVSGGVEPVYALSYIRRSESLSAENFEVLEPVANNYMVKFGIKNKKDLPDIFVVAHKINPLFRVKMQATIQQHIDSSISSTVNLPETADKSVVDKIYMYAWKLGCKSITVYREGSKKNILTEIEEKEDSGNALEESGAEMMTKEETRPYMMIGTTIKLPTNQGNLYVTINKNDDGQIKEIFINMGRSGDLEKSYTEAIGRLISVYLQSGGNAARIVTILKGIKGGTSTWFNGMQLFSVPDAIAKSIELALKKRDINTPNVTLHAIIDGGSIKSNTCPSCKQHTLIFENGCYVCKSCGYTKCE